MARAEVIRTFQDPVTAGDDRRYAARVCGRPGEDGLWEGWIEFVPEDGSPVLRSRRETKQSARRALESWARGLTRVYLEGALARTLRPAGPRPPPPPPAPAFRRPAPEWSPRRRLAPDDAPLSPFRALASGEEALRLALEDLEPDQLRRIVRAYDLADERAVEIEELPRPDLVELIVERARRRAE